MKRFLTTALAIALFVGAAQAQTTAPAQGHPRGHGKGMMQDLNLTADQKTQMKNLHQAEKKEMDGLKAQGSVTPEQRKAIRDKYKTQFDSILTQEQKDALNKKKADWKAGGEKRDRKISKGEEGRGKGGPFMNKDLNLTPDQQTKLKSYVDDFHAKAKDLRGNTSLTDDQKKEQMRSLAKQYMEQSRAVLTPDQLQKMKDLRGKHKNALDRNT